MALDIEQEDVETQVEPEVEHEEEQEALEDGAESKDEDSAGDEDEEQVITIGESKEDEESEDSNNAPSWVKDLRKQHREMKRENRELKAQLERYNSGDGKLPELGKKPKLEDFDYDTEQFEAALESWHEKKRQIDEAEKAKKDEEEQQQSQWKSRLSAYAEEKKTLKIKNFDDLEDNVTSELSVTQQGIIVQAADKPARLIAAIGGNEKVLSELKKINDPVKFAAAIGRLESQVKIGNKRKSPPPPERRISGNGSASGSVDSHLNKLRSDAEKTGDYTKVIAYKRKMRENK